MGKKVIFSIIFLLYSDVLIPCSANPLIGEKVEPAEENEFPFVVSLGLFAPSKRSERYLNHFCGGSLITQRHVLTAAHCIVNKQPHEVTVTVGNVDLNEGKFFTVESWITFDQWIMKKNELPEFPKNDIAVVTLSKNVTDIVPAVRSNLPDAKIFDNKGLLAGWGVYINGSRPRFLQKASLRVLTPKECKRKVMKLLETEDIMARSHYCTATEAPVILSCGDSGGPLLLKATKEIVGVNEATCEVKNCPLHRYSISMHVKVNYFKEFIDDVSKE